MPTFCMHQAEHLRSQTFGPMFTEIPETQKRMERLLDRSVVLNTFVYVAARSAPWIFAENNEERTRILEDFDGACRSLTPTYGMWIANQVGLLALERRAYTWWTLGRHDRAYRDFHKLIRLLRSLRGQVEQRAMRVRGTKTLVEGLTATAEHHIGRIYREQHAHRVALRYFDRASKHLEGWAEHPEIGGIMRNSRWRVDLLISRGKANYELGRVKTSLLYYARAWRAFLQLADSESEHTANLDLVTQAIEWLASIEDEPELSKAELSRRLKPLIGQFQTVYSPVHLRLLAAEIMMRLGHLLYILKLPPLDWNGEEFPPQPDHELAWSCMRQAALLDPASTLIAADLLKILNSTPAADFEEAADAEELEEPREDDKKSELPSTVPLDEQWPSGGDRFEEAVRVVEYVVQSWLNDDPEEDDSERTNGARIARELLRSFLAHTDSSNVKLAQVYNYLMQRPRELDHVGTQPSPTIELVCLRRYSSFFPLLPRPAAFRALGGGYLVRVRDEGQEPFGIAIDPGPDFLNNLFRCGYSLADVQMIVLTHDHADHSASLDSLLALLGTRQMLADPIFSKEERLTIVGNQSVVERYGFFNDDEPVRKTEDEKDMERSEPVRVMSFEQFAAISSQRGVARDEAIKGTKEKDEKKKPKILLSPKTLQIDPVKTVDHIDAGGHVAQGFLLHIGDGGERASILFTGDTGRPPAPGPNGEEPVHYEAPGKTSLASAIEIADVVVAHLSSVPLPELRDLAGLTSGPDSDDELVGAFTEIWKKAADNAGPSIEDETSFLLNQLQFAFRSRGKKGDRLAISPFDAPDKMDPPSDRHLYLAGLLDVAERMAKRSKESNRPALLLIGELREELGTFRTRIASRVSEVIFEDDSEIGTTLTTDIGLRLRVSRPPANGDDQSPVSVLCTTCDLDTDLIASERFHSPDEIREVCVKGENEGVFYNCMLHDPGKRPELPWVEAVERYNIFGD